MRLLFIITCLTILFSFGEGARAWADQNLSIEIELTSAGIRTKAGTPLSIWVAVRNGLGKPVEIKQSEGGQDAEAEYKLSIRNVDGTSPPLTEYGKEIYQGGDVFTTGVFRSTVLQPGSAVVEEVSLDKVFDLSQAGTYAVQVARKIGSEVHAPYIQSNSIMITIEN